MLDCSINTQNFIIEGKKMQHAITTIGLKFAKGCFEQ